MEDIHNIKRILGRGEIEEKCRKLINTAVAARDAENKTETRLS